MDCRGPQMRHLERLPSASFGGIFLEIIDFEMEKKIIL